MRFRALKVSRRLSPTVDTLRIWLRACKTSVPYNSHVRHDLVRCFPARLVYGLKPPPEHALLILHELRVETRERSWAVIAPISLAGSRNT